MRLRANLLLLLAAAIWGFAFVAQRVGMDHVGPFTFTGVRFALGGLSLVPLIFVFRREAPPEAAGKATGLKAGLLAGAILFAAASLQQVGLIYTTAGKAAFITCLYLVLVPVAGTLLGRRTSAGTWLGSLVAVAGLYLLCVKEDFTVGYGDFLELAGALFWTAHIMVIDRYSRRVDTLQLAFFQFMACAAGSLAVAAATEEIALSGLALAAAPILYGGLCSVGVAYTLQIVGQKDAEPSHAAIILSLETVFAAVGGYLILGEQLGTREALGCALMLAGMLASQLWSMRPGREQAREAGPAGT
jgi:drug/metabolite transporter (DMT)-like permease